MPRPARISETPRVTVDTLCLVCFAPVKVAVGTKIPLCWTCRKAASEGGGTKHPSPRDETWVKKFNEEQGRA